MSAASTRTRRALPTSLAIVSALAAVAIGLPGTLGLLLGRAPQDWPVPFGVHLAGDFALRTVIYLSGFLVAFGAIRIASILFRSDATLDHRPLAAALEGDGLSVGRGHRERPDGEIPDADVPGDATPTLTSPSGSASSFDEPDHISIAEPFYGFLPGETQARLARTTGYQALLYTKTSILITAGVGVLLAGSWEPLSAFDPVPPAAAARVGAGLYLIAESVQRLLLFARGRPSGTLVGLLLHGAVAPLRRS